MGNDNQATITTALLPRPLGRGLKNSKYQALAKKRITKPWFLIVYFICKSDLAKANNWIYYTATA